MKIFTGEDNQVLRGKAEEVETVTKDILELADKMRKTMKKEKGIGLAAPQVGVSKRVIIAMIGSEEVLMMNPQILSFSAECKVDEEGCLSLPEEFGNVSRPVRITVEFLDEKGLKQEWTLNGLDARVVQHEVDHLNGVLFTDRLVQEEKRGALVM